MVRGTFGIVAFLLAQSVPAAAEPQTPSPAGQDRASPFMRVHGPTKPPYGFVRFCVESPQECVRGPLEPARFTLTADRLKEADEINRIVNTRITAATDKDVYGVEEYWTLPVDRGDCEDYALLKRHLLVARGWPASALLMTVVRDEKGEGHAILTLRTAQGDFILDNKVNEIRAWSRTPYVYVMRQSYIDPMVWVSLDDQTGAPPGLIAGVRRVSAGAAGDASRR